MLCGAFGDSFAIGETLMDFDAYAWFDDIGFGERFAHEYIRLILSARHLNHPFGGIRAGSGWYVAVSGAVFDRLGIAASSPNGKRYAATYEVADESVVVCDALRLAVSMVSPPLPQ